MGGNKVEFRVNVPVEVALQFAKGHNVPSNFGNGEGQVMYTTVDGRKMYLAPYVAAKIAALKPQPGAKLRITKSERTDGGRGFNWSVESLEAGPQLDGTYVVPKADPVTSPEISGTGSSVERMQPQATAIRRPVTTGSVQGHSQKLARVLHNLREYAKQNNLSISPEDSRSIVISCYIQHMQGGQIGGENVAA